MELVTTCLNCGNRYRWDDKVSTTGMPDCPSCGFNNQTGKKGSEKTGKYPEGLAGALLHLDSRGDDAVEEILALASQSDRKSLAIVEDALVFLAGKKLTYFTPGPRIQTGSEVYSPESYAALLKSLTNKARKEYLLNNAAETQDEIIRITGHIEYNAGSFFNNIREAGGQEALKIVQLLDTHAKVQARLMHMGVLGRRELTWETPVYKDKKVDIKSYKIYQIILMTFFGMLGSLLIGFIFLGEYFNPLIFGLFGSLFFSILENKNKREQFLVITIIMVLYFTILNLSWAYNQFINRNDKIKFYNRSFALALFFGLINSVFSIIVLIIDTNLKITPLYFIYYSARDGILIGLGIGLGIDFYLQNKKQIFNLLELKIN